MMPGWNSAFSKWLPFLPGVALLTMLAGCATGGGEQASQPAQIETRAGKGDARAQTELGLVYLNRVPPDYNSAAIWFLTAARQGYAEAQWNLGMLYAKGLGVPKNDTVATNWLRLASEQRWPGAQPAATSAPAVRPSTPQASRDELLWSLRAAENSDAEVGKGFVIGEGMPQNYREAFKWLRGAAENGDAEAQYFLGRLYSKGIGTRPDFVEAHKWFNLAAAQGYAAAARARDSLNRIMTREDVDAAQRRAASFVVKAPSGEVAP